MYHLRLKMGLSYAGEVNGEKIRATRKEPRIKVEAEETAQKLVSSGYFVIEEGTEEPEAGQFEDWTLEELAKLAAEHEIETAGLSREELIEALAEEGAEEPEDSEETEEAAPDKEAEIREELMGRTVDQLKALAETRGVELKGVKGKEKIVEALIEADRRAAEIREAIRSED